MTTLDNTDKAILRYLQQNGKMTIREIAGKLHLSTTPVYERIKRMEKQGVIRKYVALLDATMLERNLTAFVHISLKDHSRTSVDEFVNRAIICEEILECHHISGDSDFMLKVVLRDMEAYNTFVLEKLSVIPNIGKVESRFCLSVRKESVALPI